jgi:hypothetical protein
MPVRSDERWWQYLEATLRKHEIAAYHLAQLKEVLDPEKPPQRLTVPIQTHFEGVVLWSACPRSVSALHRDSRP